MVDKRRLAALVSLLGCALLPGCAALHEPGADPDVAAVRAELGNGVPGILIVAPDAVDAAAVAVARGAPQIVVEALAKPPRFGAYSARLGDGRGCIAVAPALDADLPRLLAAGPPPPGVPDRGLLRRMLIRHEVEHCRHSVGLHTDGEALADAAAARDSLRFEPDTAAARAAVGWLAAARDLAAARTGIRSHETGAALRAVLAETP